MAGILGNDSALLGKALDIANGVAGGKLKGNEPSPQEIISADFQRRGIPAKAGFAGAMKELQQGLKMYRQENTILAIKKLSPVVAQVHFFTMDSPDTFNQIVKFYIDKLKQANCKIIYDSVADQHIISALQAAGVQLQQSDMPQFKLKGLL